MRNVPLYAQVSKSEYRSLRKSLETTCIVYGFDFMDVWNIMVGRIENRHERVLAGKVKDDISLDEAVKQMRAEVRKERHRRAKEAADAAAIEQVSS